MNNKTALIAASAIRHLIRVRYLAPTKNLVEALWSEIATANTYGNENLVFVYAIRDAEKRGKGDYWYKVVLKLVLAGSAPDTNNPK